MNMKKSKFPSEENLRTTSRDLLRVYKYVLNNPKELLISTNKFGEVLGLQGRALGGVLAGVGKVAHVPVLIRQGVAKTSRSGKYESREQLWSINPNIPPDKLEAIKEILDSMQLDIIHIRCPGCDSLGALRVGGGTGAAPEGGRLPSISYRCSVCGHPFTDRDLKS